MVQFVRKRNFIVIVMIYRQESIGFFGILVYKFISIEDSEEVFRVIRSVLKDKLIDLIIYMFGGLVLVVIQIVRVFKEYLVEMCVIVLYYVMSGGIFIVFVVDKIIMDLNVVFGLVDLQFGQYLVLSILRVVEKKGLEKVDDQILILVDVVEKVIKQVQDFVFSFFKDKYGEEKVRELVQIFMEGRWMYDYLIIVDYVREFGFNVEIDVFEEVYVFMEFYKQFVKQRGIVEFMFYFVKQESKK